MICLWYELVSNSLVFCHQLHIITFWAFKTVSKEFLKIQKLSEKYLLYYKMEKYLWMFVVWMYIWTFSQTQEIANIESLCCKNQNFNENNQVTLSGRPHWWVQWDDTPITLRQSLQSGAFCVVIYVVYMACVYVIIKFPFKAVIPDEAK